MWDAFYVLITILFFAGMLWYAFGCSRLGGDTTQDSDDNPAGGRRAGGGARDER